MATLNEEEDGAGFLSRKFLLAVAVLILASWFRVADLISADDWIRAITMVLALYGLANVSQNIALGAQKLAAKRAAGTP